MDEWNALSYFAAGCFVGAFCAGIALDRYVMRSLRESTERYREAIKLLERAE